MPNQHKTQLIGWNPSDPTLKPWIESEASRRGITRKEVLDEMAAEYREKAETGHKEAREQCDVSATLSPED